MLVSALKKINQEKATEKDQRQKDHVWSGGVEYYLKKKIILVLAVSGLS